MSYQKEFPHYWALTSVSFFYFIYDDAVPCILKSQRDEKAFRENWARLIQKIYEVDPLVCPKCKGAMKLIDYIGI